MNFRGFKSGLSTAFAIASLSMASAGIMSTDYISNFGVGDSITNEVNSLSTYISAVSARLASDPYAIDEFPHSTSSDDFPHTHPFDKKLKGTIWLKEQPGYAALALANTRSTTLYWPSLSLTNKPITSSFFIPLTKSRHLFTQYNDDRTQHKPTCENSAYPTKNTGSWLTLPDQNQNDIIPQNILPCNFYVLKGPLKTDHAASITTTNIHNLATLSLAMEELDPNSSPPNPNIYSNPNPNPNNPFVIPIPIKTSLIQSANIKIPLGEYIDYSKRGLIRIVRQLKSRFPSYPIYFTYGNKNDTTYKDDEANYGLSASLILSDKCNEDNTKTCFLNIRVIPDILPAIGSGGDGCTDCLKTDGSNYMTKPIRFFKQDATDYPGGTPIVAFKVTTNASSGANLTAAQVQSGIITTGAVGSPSDGIKIIGEENIIISSYVGQSSLSFSKNLSDVPPDPTTPPTPPTPTQAPSMVFNIVLNNESLFTSQNDDTDLFNNETKKIVFFKDGNPTDTSDNVPALTITSGMKGPRLQVGTKDYFQVQVSQPSYSTTQYYKLATISKGGEIFINGILGNTNTFMDESATINIRASYSGLSSYYPGFDAQIPVEALSVSGFVFGNITGNPDIVFTTSSGLTDDNAIVWLKSGVGSDININIKASTKAEILFDNTTSSLSGTPVLSISNNNTFKQNSKIIRIDNAGTLEPDSQDIRISKPLDEWPEYPGDCAYTGASGDCPAMAMELATFLSAVPNIEKTIDLIKKYTPNKYIAYESLWTGMRSITAAPPPTQDVSIGSMFSAYTTKNFTFKNEDGVPTEFPDLPARVKVLVRNHLEACPAVPISMADDDGYVYQEALPSQAMDDGDGMPSSLHAAGIQYYYNKKHVSVSAAVDAHPDLTGNPSHREILMINTDANDGTPYRCSYAEVKVIVYRPEQVSHHEIQIPTPDPIKTYDSGWLPVVKNTEYSHREHKLGKVPTKVFVYQASDSNGSNMMLVDSIYSGSNHGYGSWLQKITSNDYELSTGKTSAMSGYGKNSHWDWDNGSGYIKVIME